MLFRVQPIHNPWCSAAEGFARGRAYNGNQDVCFEDSFALWKVQSMHPEMCAVGLWQHDGCSVVTHDLANTCRNCSQQFLKIKVRHDLIGQAEDKFQPVLCLSRQVEVHGSINGQCNLVGNHGEKANFVFGIGVRTRCAYAYHTEAALSSGQRKDTRTCNTEFAQELAVLAKAWLLIPIGDDESLL